jgi:hypothetical protein
MQLSTRSGRTAVDGTHSLAKITLFSADAAAELIGHTAFYNLGNGDGVTNGHPPSPSRR